MTVNSSKLIFVRVVALFTFCFLLGIFLLPIAATAHPDDCNDNCAGECQDNCQGECEDNCETACGCIGCPQVILAFDFQPSDNIPVLKIQGVSITPSSLVIEHDLFQRLDRPPQPFI